MPWCSEYDRFHTDIAKHDAFLLLVSLGPMSILSVGDKWMPWSV